MNEQLKALAEQAGLCIADNREGRALVFGGQLHVHILLDELERFAELVRQELIAMYKQALTDPENQPSQYGTVTVEYMGQKIAAEREACAKLCDDWLVGRDDICEVAKTIRARGNHEQD